MFRDREKELKRLEAQLLEQEEPEDTDELLEQMFSGSRSVSARNTDRVDLRPEALSMELDRPPKKKRAGCVLAFLLGAAILAVGFWWLSRGGL